jgi:outer membrane protein assembly factor BamB
MKTRSLPVLAICFLGLPLSLLADDWPQFRGPDRTDISKENGLFQKWPKNGPSLLWTFKKTGIGFSGPAIVGDRLYIMGARKDDQGKELEYLIALDLASKGKELWAVPIGPVFTWKGNSYGDGPRGTPTVDGKRIYALGGQGILICVDLTKEKPEKPVWTLDFRKERAGKHMNLWGYCESPLVDGDQVVCSPGGRKGTIIALHKFGGKPKWSCKKLTDEATFGSMVVANFGGVRQYVQTTFKGPGQGGRIVGVAAKTGDLLWSVDQKFDDVDVCATPIVHMDSVYLSGGRKAGCTLLHVRKNGKDKFEAKIDPGYKKSPIRRVMDNEHGGVVLLGDYLYGYSDSRGGGWVCQELKTGKAVWTEKRKLGKGCLTCAGGQLYLYSEDDGRVVLLEPTPTKENYWKENGRFEIPEKSKVPQTRKSNSGAKIWTHPVVANGRLYLRDQEFLFCYDVQANKQVKKAKK